MQCILGWRSVLSHFRVIVTLTSDLVSIWCISYILFKIGTPNLVYGCIFGWWYVVYHFWVTVTLTSDLVLRIILSGTYTFVISVRNPKFVVWLHFGMVECHVPVFWSLWPWPIFLNYRVRSISPISFEVEFPNLVYGCIFGWWYVTDFFKVTMTYDLVSRIMVSRAYCLYYLR